MHARGLRDENEREGLVKAGAVHVEAVAGGQDKRHDLTRNAEGFHFSHGDRQSSFRAGSGKAQRDGLSGDGDERLQRNARQKQDGNQHEKNEEHESDIHCGEELQEGKNDGQAQVPDGVSNCSEDADRRGAHHNVGELEHGLREAFCEGQHRAALGLGNQGKCKREENAEDHDLEHLAFGDGLGNVLGENVGDDLRRGVWRNSESFAGSGGRQVNALSRAAQVDGGQANEHGNGGDQFEVDERFDAQPADFFQVRVAGNPHHEHGKKQRRNDDANQAQKDGSEQLKLRGRRRRVVSQFRTGKQADENPRRQRPPRSRVSRHGYDGQPTQHHGHQGKTRPNTKANLERSRNGNRRRNQGRQKKFAFHRNLGPCARPRFSAAF